MNAPLDTIIDVIRDSAPLVVVVVLLWIGSGFLAFWFWRAVVRSALGRSARDGTSATEREGDRRGR